jgi:hypothetical protein
VDEIQQGTGLTGANLDPQAAEPETNQESEAATELPGGGIVSHLQAVAEPVANVMEPIVGYLVSPVAGAIGSVLGAANDALAGRGGSLARQLRRRGREPLTNLFDVHPEAREASPRELGLRFVPTEEIRGTAVAGAAQRGGDFLPLKPFRGTNWEGRWQRIRSANDRLESLPPVDLIKYAGGYWVLDGHNRVAATLYSNGVGLDAMVTELIPLDGQTSERPTGLLSYLRDAGTARAASQLRTPAPALLQDEPVAEAPDMAAAMTGFANGSAAGPENGSAAGADGDRVRTQASDGGGTLGAGVPETGRGQAGRKPDAP